LRGDFCRSNLPRELLGPICPSVILPDMYVVI
jgi:hypothetical protein